MLSGVGNVGVQLPGVSGSIDAGVDHTGEVDGPVSNDAKIVGDDGEVVNEALEAKKGGVVLKRDLIGHVKGGGDGKGVQGLKSVGHAIGSHRDVQGDGHSYEKVCKDDDGESLLHVEEYVEDEIDEWDNCDAGNGIEGDGGMEPNMDVAEGFYVEEMDK